MRRAWKNIALAIMAVVIGLDWCCIHWQSQENDRVVMMWRQDIDFWNQHCGWRNAK